jgi:hypothetical protein
MPANIHHEKTNPILEPIHLLTDEDTAVAHLTGSELLDGLVAALLGEGELLNDGLDLVVGGELEHAVLDVPGGDEGSLDGETVDEEVHVRDGEVAASNAEREDGGAGREGGDEELPVGLGGGGDEESVDLALSLELLEALHGDELAGTESHGLVLLAVGTGEDNDAASHLGGVLDGEVTKATNANHAHGLGWLDVVHVEGVEDGGTTTHQRRGDFVTHVIGDLEEESLTPDGALSHAALVEVGHAVHLTLGAEGLVAAEALLAVTARVVLVTPANAVTLLEDVAVGAELLHDTDTLVAETHAGLLVVEVSTAETGGGDAEEDLVALELRLLGGGLDDLAGLGALVDDEGRHLGWLFDVVVVWVLGGRVVSRWGIEDGESCWMKLLDEELKAR